MTATRVVLMVGGVALGLYGVLLLMDNSTEVIIRIVAWALIGVLLHDAVFAPVCLALGFAGRRILPHRWWTPILVASLCTVVLVLLAIPVYTKPGLHLDNLTVLDRDYRAGFWIALGLEVSQVVAISAEFRAYELTTEEVYEALGRVDAGSCDAVVMSGTGMLSIPAGLKVGKMVRVPFLSSNLCSAWWVLRQLGIPASEALTRCAEPLARTLAARS